MYRGGLGGDFGDGGCLHKGMKGVEHRLALSEKSPRYLPVAVMRREGRTSVGVKVVHNSGKVENNEVDSN